MASHSLQACSLLSLRALVAPILALDPCNRDSAHSLSAALANGLLSKLPARQMEYPVVAPASGEVKAILVEGSQLTHQGDALLVLAAT